MNGKALTSKSATDLPNRLRDEEGGLRRFIRRRMGPELRLRVETEDLLQSALLAAVRDLRNFDDRGPGSLGAWLRAVAQRKVLMAGRFHRAGRRDVRREHSLTRPDARPVHRTSPSQIVARTEGRSRIREAISLLPEPHRRIVEMHSLDEMPFPRVARELGLPDAEAARYRFRVALGQLRRLLSGCA